MNFIAKILNTGDIPKGVKVLTYVTSVRWVGWGFAEALLPVFLFTFTGSYAATSLLRSSYDIAFILFLPIAGVLADRFRASSLVMIGLVIYLFIGVGYFLAGVLGMVIFAVIARFLNGVSYSFDVIGRDTYARRFSSQNKLATVFGYVDTVVIFWWIVAAIAGVFLIKYFSIHALLFLVTPTSLVALVIIWYFRQSENKIAGLEAKGKIKNAYFEAAREFSCWGWNLRLLSVFNFFISFSGAVISFFLPIESYSQNGDLSKALLIGIFLVIPNLFGFKLGQWFDKKGISLFSYGFLLFAVFLISLALFDSYFLKLGVAFGVGIILELFQVGSNELITNCANPEHYGRIGGVMRSIYDVGAMIGPLTIGIMIDWQGVQLPYILLAGLMLSLAVLFHFLKNKIICFFTVNTPSFHHRVHQR